MDELRDITKQEHVCLTVKEPKRATARISNWKATVPNHVQGFWFARMRCDEYRIILLEGILYQNYLFIQNSIMADLRIFSYLYLREIC